MVVGSVGGGVVVNRDFMVTSTQFLQSAHSYVNMILWIIFINFFVWILLNLV